MKTPLGRGGPHTAAGERIKGVTTQHPRFALDGQQLDGGDERVETGVALGCLLRHRVAFDGQQLNCENKSVSTGDLGALSPLIAIG